MVISKIIHRWHECFLPAFLDMLFISWQAYLNISDKTNIKIRYNGTTYDIIFIFQQVQALTSALITSSSLALISTTSSFFSSFDFLFLLLALLFSLFLVDFSLSFAGFVTFDSTGFLLCDCFNTLVSLALWSSFTPLSFV